MKIESNMKIWHYLLLVAASLSLIGFFFLPNAVAGITDSRRMDSLIMVDSQSTSFDTAAELALPERIALAANPQTEILPMKTGKAMDADTAKERVDRELARLFYNSPFRFDFNGYTVEESAAALVIDAAVPTLNMMIWELMLQDRSENTVTVALDDETGLILRLIYRFGGDRDDFLVEAGANDPSDDAFYPTARSLAEMMREYYGLAVTLADYELGGNSSMAYYRADLFGGNRIIPMYGVVRATSFTINERLKNR